MKHSNEIAIKVLNDEYGDYSYNSQDYDLEYKMVVRALEMQSANQSLLKQIPDNIDFSELKTDLERQIINEEKLISLLEYDIEILDKKEKQSSDDKKTLSFLKNQLIDHKNALKSKQALYNEYIIRCVEEELRKKEEKNDYFATHKQVHRKALELKKDFNIPKDLRKHLSMVLKRYNSKFSLVDAIAFHVALKKEVEICENYKNNS